MAAISVKRSFEMKKKIRHKQHNLTADFFSGEAGIELKPRNMKTCSYPTN